MKRFTYIALAGLCSSLIWFAGCSQCSTCGKTHVSSSSCCEKPMTTTGGTVTHSDTTHGGKVDSDASK